VVGQKYADLKAKCIEKLNCESAEQVYALAKTDNQLFSDAKSRKLQYFGHVMKQPHNDVENNVMTGLVEGS